MLSLLSWLALVHRRLTSCTPQPRKRLSHRQFSPVAGVERLEQRQLLSGTATLNGTTLEIVGDNLANSVNVALINPTTLDVNIDGAHTTFDPSLVDHITIDGLNGNDVLTIATSVTETAEINGGDGNDNMTAGAGDTTMTGGIGNDWYIFKDATSSTTDTVVELAGEGSDTLYLNAISDAVIVDLTSDSALATMTNRTVQTGAAGQAANFENVYGGLGNDTITGNVANNGLYGDGGTDTLTGLGGADLLTGGAGNDTLEGGAGNDTYAFNTSTGLGSDTITEVSGIDSLNFNGSTNNVIVNIGLTTAQVVNANLTLTIDTATSLENSYGGSGNDILTGNSLNNSLSGFGGNDSLLGGDGNDFLNGGDGSDTMTGGVGDDTYVFANTTSGEVDTVVEQGLTSQGIDTLDCAAVTGNVSAFLSNDSVLVTMTNRRVQTGGSGQAASFENIAGGSGDDFLQGNDAINALSGNSGDDVLEGGLGGDTLTGGEGEDVMAGQAGNDTYAFADTSVSEIDTLIEDQNAGTDALDLKAVTSNTTVQLTNDISLISMANRRVKTGATGQAQNFENVQGGLSNDVIFGNFLINTLSGNGGADYINGGANNDKLLGGVGNDILVGGDGSDTYMFNTNSALGSDTVGDNSSTGDLLDFTGSTGNVTVDISLTTPQTVNANLVLTFDSATAIDNITGGSGNDTLTGNSLNNVIVGSVGNDTLNGSDGNDIFVGGAGDDSQDGGLGNDTYILNTNTALGSDSISDSGGTDLLDFSASTNNVTVDISLTTLQVVNGNLSLTFASGTAIDNINGGSGNDTLTGNSLNNALTGNAGDDDLTGGDGDDTLTGGAGSENLAGGLGNDKYIFVNATTVENETITELAGEGVDLLDFSTVNGNLTVNLNNDTIATMQNRTVLAGAAGQSANFENVSAGFGTSSFSARRMLIGNASANVLLIGGRGDNVLSGGDGDDVLQGSIDSDVLIGGGGTDTLTGDRDNDLLLGGIYSLELDPVALAALQNEWSSPTPFENRVGHLMGALPGGVNGSFTLTQSTVTDDGLADTITSGPDQDWYITGPEDVTDFNGTGSEIHTPITSLPPS